jgi:hypothetical protein
MVQDKQGSEKGQDGTGKSSLLLPPSFDQLLPWRGAGPDSKSSELSRKAGIPDFYQTDSDF